MSNKKDLTRIEDLGEFLHELEAEEESTPLSDEVPAWEPAGESWEPTSEESLAEEPSEFSLPEESPSFEDATIFDEQEAPSDDSASEDSFSLTEETPPALEFASEPAIEDEPLWEDSPLEEPDPVSDEPAAPPVQREDFQEVRDFAEKATFTEAPTDSNPAHSVMAQGIRFTEDADDIMLILKELNFPEEMLSQFRRQLERGTLLVPRVSEYTAIWLCHKLRRFRLELQSGPSDILHPPRGQRDRSTGLVSRRSLGQNQHHQFRFEGDTDAGRLIMLSTLPHLDGHVIERYVGVASEHAVVPGEKVEDETDNSIHAYYDELAQKLKAHALDKRANAVVGVNYQLTPLPAGGSLQESRYRLTCTGNLVWVTPLGK